ncbi:phage protein, HK97 gp10 family [Teladorsagia circumcincta]|uniref:Phage protein, HK97 gp10 family n=1 Tax=Teladorsagia circumcincta TaxID=45464 RepID=A0A2G9V4J6_TELCI|nr:phage protein, HK97 gp10 family [Teladorsagia circumcincta]
MRDSGKSFEELRQKTYEYFNGLPEERQQSECHRLLGSVPTTRHVFHKHFEKFTNWMTDDQRRTMTDMRDSGKSFEELRQKTYEYFNTLPEERQQSVRESYKGQCQPCAEMLAKKTRTKRDIDEKINKRLSWMTADQKMKVKQMYADGKPQAEIRAKIFEFLSELEGPAGSAAKEQTQKECYKWMNDVATEEEIAALHKMHETDHDGCKKKVREFIERLPETKKDEVLKNLPFCEKIWYGDHEHHHGHHHRRHLAARRRRHLHAIDKFLHWLTPDQKSELEGIEQSGSHFDNVIAKVKEFFGLLPEEKKAELKANFKDQCSAWVKEVATPEEMESIKKMHETKDFGELKKKIAELEDRLTEDQKHTVEHVREVCYGVWELDESTRRRRDHHTHDIEEGMQKFLTWLTDEQKQKVKATYESGDREAFYKEIMTMFDAASGEVKAKASEELKSACKHYGKDLMGEDKMKVIKEMKDSGATHEAISQKIEEMVEEMTDEEKKAKAKRFTAACKKVYGPARFRRDHQHPVTLEEALHKYLTWLSDDQKAELKSLKESGDKEAIYKKVMDYFQGVSGEKKEKASEELKAACKHYIKEILGAEKATEFHEKIAEKIEEAIDGLTDEHAKSMAKKASSACKRIFGVARRFRRDHQHPVTLEEALHKYLTWLSDDQKAELKSLKESGDKEAIYKKVMDFFQGVSGEKKEKASEELKAACKHYIKEILGAEKAAEFRAMKESGTSDEKIAEKIEEAIDGLTDEHAKSMAKKASAACKRIFGVARRFRRDEQHPVTLEEALDKYLTWLSDDQKAELKSLKESGDKESIYKKVLEYFEDVSGEKKEKAAEELKAACKHLIEKLLGVEKAAEFRAMRESGTPAEKIAEKIEEAIDELTDEGARSRAKKASAGCKRIFGVVRRVRRDEQHPVTLEEALDKYLTWLSDDQKAELKSLKESGDKESIYKKVLEYFEDVSGEKKEKAAEELKAACKHLIEKLLGAEKAAEFRAMRESATPLEKIAERVEEAIEDITDEVTRSRARKASAGCKRIFGVVRRVRRDEHHPVTLEEALHKYLTWLSDDQKAELKSLKESGDRETIYKKVMEYFEGVSGEKKEKASEELQAACKHYIKEILGDEKAAEFRAMKESGTPAEKIAEKIEQAIDELSDEGAKSRAKKASSACKRIFGVVHRVRRDQQHPITLEEALDKYLTWLSDEQKEELKSLKESGDKESIYKKVMEYFEGTSGEQKDKASEELKAACKHFIEKLLGAEKAAEFRAMRESATPLEKIAERIEEAIEDITDEITRSRAKKASAACKRIFGVLDRVKRDHHHEHSLEDAMEKYLTWLTESQKEEIKSLYKEGGRGAVYDKVMEYFDKATGDTKEKAAMELKGACKHYVKDLIGEKNGEVIKEMKENGASNDEIATKVEEMIEAIADDKKKAQALRASANCRKIYGVARRFRRDHKHNLEEAMEKYLTWLNDDQKEEVKKLYSSGDKQAMYKKVMEIYDSVSGDVKEKATVELKAACRHYVKDSIGEENAEKLKEMKESGATPEAIAAKVEEFIAAITDEKKKSEAERASVACKKIYGVARRFRRDHKHNLEEAMEKYLSWLNDEQKEEVKKLYGAGDKQAMYKKVMEIYDSVSGDVKEKATVELKAACRHYVKDSIGEENAEKLKEMKESGATPEAIAAKVEEFIAAISDEKKKSEAERAAVACKRIYGVARRLKRDHKHNLEEAMEKYLSWLNDDQKEEVKKLYGAGDKQAMYKKVMEIYDSVSGDVKEKATVELKAACRHYVKDSIGEENAEKLKEMKESGATPEAIAAKVEEFIAAISDEKKKSEAERAAVACKRIYGVARRLKREHHEHNLEEAMEKYLTWLNDDQKEEVKKLYGSGDKQAMYKKVMEIYDSVSGDVKEKATVELKAACGHYVKESIGEENAEKLKEMKESGATPEAIATKLEEFIATISDEKKKSEAERASVACKKIYGVARRLKRDHHEHNLEEAMEKYLSWLRDDQKAEVKKIYGTGDRIAVETKVLQMFENASGDVKEKASVQLRAACKHYIKEYIGDENVAKIKELKDSGATNEAMSAKIDEFIAAIPEKERKEKAERVAASCKKVYGVKSRMRRYPAAQNEFHMEGYNRRALRAHRHLAERRRRNEAKVHFLDI